MHIQSNLQYIYNRAIQIVVGQRSPNTNLQDAFIRPSFPHANSQRYSTAINWKLSPYRANTRNGGVWGASTGV